MKKYLIGSAALHGFYPDFKRNAKDIDFLVENGGKANLQLLDGTRMEYHICPPLWDYLEFYESDEVRPDVLLTLKVSHIFWDIFWDKHLYDIIFLFGKGCKVIRPLFDHLYDYWNEYHGKNKRSDLKMTKEDFFDNALKKYDHDALHYILNPVPIFTKILKDGEEVDVDEEKFNRLSFEDKLNLVREEIYVMAFERRGNRNYRTVWSWMLKKFIISHAPIWEALFILENHRYLYKPEFNYIEFFKEKLQEK